MADEKKGLVREEGTVRPRTGRVERARGDGRSHNVDEAWDAKEESDGKKVESVRRRRGQRGRPPLTDEVGDLNRGVAFAAAESVAITMDIMSRVLRGVVDRAFDEDYSSPGDVARGLANEADLAVYDLVDELRGVPRRLDHRFDEAVRSPRADRGERARRADEDKK